MSSAVFKSDSAVREIERLYRHVLDQWPVAKDELRVSTGQGSTFVVASGPKDAPPLILLHGAQANSAAWLPDVELWSSKFRVYAVDLIGEAGFSAQVRPPLDDDSHANWLGSVFAELGLASAAIVGTSLGGWVALDFAVRSPGSVDALALISPAGIGRQKNFLLKAAPLLLLGRWGRHKMREMVFGPEPDELPSQLRLIGELMESISRGAKPRVVSIPRVSDEQLARLQMPILVIVGGRDVILDAYDTKARLDRCLPHAEVCFIENGYHFLPQQSVRVFDFLESCVRKGGPVNR